MWIFVGNFNFSSVSIGEACSTDETIPYWRFNKLTNYIFSGNSFSDVIPEGWLKVNSSDLYVIVDSELVNYDVCPTPTPTQTPTMTPTTPLTLYYNTTPTCDTINPFNNVVLDNNFCSATTITSSTVLPDGTYWIVDTLSGRRDVTASSGTYTFNGGCVGCA